MTEAIGNSGQEPTLAVETVYEDTEMTLARIVLRGINRRIINHASTTTYTVISGEGMMYVDGAAHELRQHVTVTVPSGTPYYDEGNVDMVAISIPPFDATSIEYLD